MESSYAESCSSTLSPLGQSLVELTPANIEILLSEASVLVHHRRAEAEAILARLRQLNPALASEFAPKQEVVSELRLRLITPAAEELPSTFDSFIVVSYCWHYPEWALPPAAESIAPAWEISRPMVDAVMGLRRDAGEGVWLDKLCINQSDTRDKMVHIGAMDIIYRSARGIVILLEDIQLTAEEEAAGLEYAAFFKDMRIEADARSLDGNERLKFIRGYFPSREPSSKVEDLQKKAHSFGLRILNARWFTRAWCAHESRVSPHGKFIQPLLLCFGADGRVLSFEFRFLYYLAMYIGDNVEEPVSLKGNALIEALHDANPQTLQQMWWRMQRLMPERSEPGVVSTLHHLVNIMQFGCAKHGDLMSIALNTASVPLAFAGEASTTEDVVWMFSLLVLAEDDVMPLFVDGGKLGVPDEEAPGGKFVSWAVHPQQGSVEKRTPSPRIDTITSVTRDYIELDLLVFETLPSAPTAEAFETAKKMIEDYGLANLLQKSDDERVQRQYKLMEGEALRAKSEVLGVKETNTPLTVFIPMWIAHAIDCGLEWTLRFPDVMKADTEEEWSYEVMGDASDERLADAASFLLDHLTTKDEVSQEGRDRDRDVQAMVKFLTCILDPRLSFLTIAPRRLARGNGDFAFTASGSNRAWIAIPAAIAHLQGWQKRAWALSPCNPSTEPRETPQDHLPDINVTLTGDESAEDLFPVLPSDYADKRKPIGEAWELRRREEIFGCLPFTGTEADAVDGSVMYLKKQRVYGSEDFDWRGLGAAISAFEAKHGLKQSSKVRDAAAAEAKKA